MFKSVVAATVMAAAAVTSSAEEFNLQPEDKDAQIMLTATAQLSFKNDLATIRLYAQAEEHDLADAQSKVNAAMAKAQGTIREFSSMVRIENDGYYTQAIYTEPKKGEAPQIAGWRARQSIRVVTEDVDGVGSLVQLAQQSGLALDGVSYSMSDEAKSSARDHLSKAAVQALNQQTESVALAMKLAPQSLKFKKLEFTDGGFPEGVMARGVYMSAAANAKVAAPAFEAGSTKLSMSVAATLTVDSPLTP